MQLCAIATVMKASAAIIASWASPLLIIQMFGPPMQTTGVNLHRIQAGAGNSMTLLTVFVPQNTDTM
jgi:hypothetical protein